MNKCFFSGLLCLSLAFSAFSQSAILTASTFFQTVSEQYGSIKDYEANIQINANNTKMSGKVSFVRPNLLRIDFENPESQVIVFNGDLLTIYLPGPKAVLNQSVASESSSTGANLATPQGLALMSRYYSVAYESGQDSVELDPDSGEMVVRLVLNRKNASEGFKTIKLSVLPDLKLIRRVEAISTSDETFVFDFTNYALNQNIPVTRFIYDAPSSANNYNNFLFTE